MTEESGEETAQEEQEQGSGVSGAKEVSPTIAAGSNGRVSAAQMVQADSVVADIRSNPELEGKMLGRALVKLSKELYSKDNHFVLELIQNADDNSYQTAVTPSVEVVISEEGMVIKNNEVGFTAEDVAAIWK